MPGVFSTRIQNKNFNYNNLILKLIDSCLQANEILIFIDFELLSARRTIYKLVLIINVDEIKEKVDIQFSAHGVYLGRSFLCITYLLQT
jgi:hypothetical protein